MQRQACTRVKNNTEPSNKSCHFISSYDHVDLLINYLSDCPLSQLVAKAVYHASMPFNTMPSNKSTNFQYLLSYPTHSIRPTNGSVVLKFLTLVI